MNRKKTVSYFDTLKRGSDMHKSTRSNLSGTIESQNVGQPEQPYPDDHAPTYPEESAAAGQPEAEVEDQEDEREPKLYVDVNVASFGLQRIIVYEGDTVESLVSEFVQRCPIDSFMVEKLKNLLQQQIDGVLERIDEDEDLDDDEEKRQMSNPDEDEEDDFQ